MQRVLRGSGPGKKPLLGIVELLATVAQQDVFSSTQPRITTPAPSVACEFVICLRQVREGAKCEARVLLLAQG